MSRASSRRRGHLRLAPSDRRPRPYDWERDEEPDPEECPAGGMHRWVDELTEAQLLTSIRPRDGQWAIHCDECGAPGWRRRSEP